MQNRHDPTAWQLYKREHPEWSHSKRSRNYVVLNLSIMAVILGGIWLVQHPSALLAVGIPALGLLGLMRSK